MPKYEVKLDQPCANFLNDIIIVTHVNDSHCTARLNLDTLTWRKRENKTILPIAGYLIRCDTFCHYNYNNKY